MVSLCRTLPWAQMWKVQRWRIPWGPCCLYCSTHTAPKTRSELCCSTFSALEVHSILISARSSFTVIIKKFTFSLWWCCWPTGTTDENLSKLIQHVKIEDEREFILNWKELGVPIITAASVQKNSFLSHTFLCLSCSLLLLFFVAEFLVTQTESKGPFPRRKIQSFQMDTSHKGCNGGEHLMYLFCVHLRWLDVYTLTVRNTFTALKFLF